MFCQKCGTQIPNDSAFCTHCGAPTNTHVVPSFAFFDKSGISKAEESFSCDLSINDIDAKICNMHANGLSLNLNGRNVLPDGFEYSITSNTSLFSWGEIIYIKCLRQGSGSYVTVFSKSAFPLQIISWGKHRRNISKFKVLLAGK